MSGIMKFKTFKEARDSIESGMYCYYFNSEKMGRYFRQLSGLFKVPYKPGLYKFRSFNEARDYDRKLYIKMAVKRDYLFLKGKKEYLEKNKK